MTLLQMLLIDHFVRGLGWTLLHSLWQIFAIAALTALLLTSLRRATAQVRYAIACVAMAAMFLVVPCTLAYVLAGPTPTPLPPLAAESFSIAAESPRSDLSTATVESGQASSALDRCRYWYGACVDKLDLAAPYLAFIWLMGFMFSSIRAGASCWNANRLIHSGVETLPERIQLAIDRLAKRIGVARPLQALASAQVDVPCIVGWLRPVLLVPISLLCEMPPHQLEALLAHELAHVRRHDYCVNLVQRFIESALFYHPAAWWLGRRIREERENCCDDIAVSCCGGVADYAGALAKLEESRVAIPDLAMAASTGSLLARIRRLAAPDTNLQSSRVPGMINAMVIIGLLVTVGAKWDDVQCPSESAPGVQVGSIRYSDLDGLPSSKPTTPAQHAVAERLREQFSIADEDNQLREVVARLSRATSLSIVCPLELGLSEIHGRFGAKPLADELQTILSASHLGCRVETDGVLRIVPASQVALPMPQMLQFAARLNADALRRNLFGGESNSISELMRLLEERIPAAITRSDRDALKSALRCVERVLPSNMAIGSIRVQAERDRASESECRFAVELGGMCRTPRGSAADRISQIEDFKRRIEATPGVMHLFDAAAQIRIRDGADFPNPLPNVTAFSLVLKPRDS